MAIPSQVSELIQRYNDNRNSYRSEHYNEAQVRQEFLNPFFAALGWDVDNTQGFAEAYKDVVHEDSIKIGGVSKAPDYSFRVGGTRKFFLEAKKPSVYLKLDKSAAFQLRRYAWSAKLPLSILTNFAEFAVYDCRLTPEKDDPASKGRLFYFTAPDYAEKWDEITDIFSKIAVLKGSFDRYAESSKGKRGTAEVDAAFLTDIENWRGLLARNLALRNPELSQRQLNFAVQRTIDRIVFLRICEDRGIEPYGRLQALLNGKNAYPRLCEMLHEADDRYNSGLFHFGREKGREEEPDDLTLRLHIDDKTLHDILRGLYYPDSPYVFSVVPADILGQVYEQFLGKVIRLTDGHRAVIEDKPEVKKAGGVYYTPTYIVDYIVTHTVGKLLASKTPTEAAALKILDPACGSGSFLIGAYQHLLDWHRDWYVADGAEKWSKGSKAVLYAGPGGVWRLTTGERKRILLNNIYGVDIDDQAVEVTKLSLLLKVLEGENAETVASNLKLFKERALPDLGDNIKCGNSLIGPDFYNDPKMAALDTETQVRINAFDWQTEFAAIMKKGGFDAVIGNPPYGIVFNENLKPYLENTWRGFTRNNDNYAAFVQRGMSLLKPRGLFGFIVPNTYLLGPYFDELKSSILRDAKVSTIVDFGLLQIFPKPNVFTSLLFLERVTDVPQDMSAEYVRVLNLDDFFLPLTAVPLGMLELKSLRWQPANALNDRVLRADYTLNDFAWVKDVGLNYWTQGRGKMRGGSIADRVLYAGVKQNPDDRAFIKGRDINRYRIDKLSHWLRHDYQTMLDPKVDTMRFSLEYLEPDKLVYRQTSDRITATLDTSSILTDKTAHVVVLKDNRPSNISLHYLLGLMNSKLITHLYRHLAQEEGRTFAQVKVFRVKMLPIHSINFEDPTEKARHDKMVSLVERMLTLNKDLPGKMRQEKTVMQRQIEATDKQIDALVYELYGLTEDEIKIVEGQG